MILARRLGRKRAYIRAFILNSRFLFEQLKFSTWKGISIFVPDITPISLRSGWQVVDLGCFLSQLIPRIMERQSPYAILFDAVGISITDSFSNFASQVNGILTCSGKLLFIVVIRWSKL